MRRKHNHYSAEFRAEAVRLCETSGQSIRQVASRKNSRPIRHLGKGLASS
jgi:transposase-like protein